MGFLFCLCEVNSVLAHKKIWYNDLTKAILMEALINSATQFKETLINHG